MYLPFFPSLDRLSRLTLRWACCIENDRHLYTTDLLELAPDTPSTSHSLNPALPAWEPYLSRHPDQQFAQFIRNGFREGFPIGFHRPLSALRSARKNHPSANGHPEVITEQIRTELEAGRLSEASPNETIHISPLGLVPKSGQQGKWRLIMDLSSPRGYSVNDGIDPHLCSLKYAAIDQAVTFIHLIGKGTLLAKLDLKSAYRRVPVRRADQNLLGFRWQGKIYTDTALPFGLRSAPKIFSAVADALSWAMICNGVDFFIHYLDDFLFFGPPTSATTSLASLHQAIHICTLLKFPVAPEKTVVPTDRLVFLGIEINTSSGMLSLPREKLLKLQELLRSWMDRKAAPKRELLSLLGHMSHAASVIRPGRIFVRHLIDAAARAQAPHHFIRLTKHCRADLLWWSEFASSWNGTAICTPHDPSVWCYTDASGSWGCGAFLSTSPAPWFQLQWPEDWATRNIAAKELIAIVIAAAIWGAHWKGLKVMFKSDNTAAVTAIMSGSAKDPTLRHLLRCFFFISAEWDFSFLASHIPGRLNNAADALSRNHVGKFFSIVSHAETLPSHIPVSLQGLLLDQDVCWTSAHWRTQFRAFMAEACQPTQSGHMSQGSAGLCDFANKPV